MNIIYFSENQKDVWDDFVARYSQDGGLLQSFAWGNFQEKLGKKIWRIGVKNNNDELVLACLVFKDDLALGKTSLEIYRGPIINFRLPIEDLRILLKKLLSELKKIAEQENVMVIRIDFGLLKDFNISINNLKTLGLIRADRDIQPRSTILIDLKLAEAKILELMKPKHRYNIKLAEKKGVEILKVDKNSLEENFSSFWNLTKITSERDSFAIHDEEYYKHLLDSFDGEMKLYLAKYNNKIIAGAIIGCFGNTCVYLHGASDNEYRNVMAPYLLQWKIIKDAKEKGFLFYDFGGVQSVGKKSSSQKGWEGISRFKFGFNPEAKVHEFLGLFELPVKKFDYWSYKIIRRIVKVIKK